MENSQENPDQHTTTVSVRLPASILQSVERLAEGYGISVAQELRVLIRIGAFVQSRFPRSLEETQEVLEEIDFESIQFGLNAPVRKVEERIGLVLSEMDLGPTHPTFLLIALPISPGNIDIPSLFTSQDTDIVKWLDHPPELRRHGFDISTGSPARIIEGRRRRAMLLKYKALNLWRDGTLMFAADGGPDFLSWGNYPKQGALRVNPLALIESTYLFSELSRLVYSYTQPTPTAIEYRLCLWNMTVNNQPFVISPGPVQAIDFGFNLYTSPKDTRANFAYRHKGSEINAGLISFQLISKVYEWIGLTHDEVPYSISEGNQRLISSDLLKAPNKL